HLGATARRVGPSAGGGQLELEGGPTLEGTDLLVAGGRTPNSDRLDCAPGGIAPDPRGFIRGDERPTTTPAGLYSTRGAAGAPQFTHVSYDDYRVLRAELLGGPPRSPVGRLVPYTLFTDPQLGRVGVTETEARARGLPIRIAQLPMSQVARAIELGETRGML